MAGIKKNNYAPDEIGKRIPALSNGACLTGHRLGYLIFGIEDDSHNIVGTKFKISVAQFSFSEK